MNRNYKNKTFYILCIFKKILYFIKLDSDDKIIYDYKLR